MKKTLALALAAVMAVSLAACGGGSSSGGSSSGGGSSSSSGEIRLVNNKVEIDEGLKKLAAKYEEETGAYWEGVTRMVKKLEDWNANNMGSIKLDDSTMAFIEKYR